MKINIENYDDMQDGDWVKAEYVFNGAHPFEGELWSDRHGNAYVGGTEVREGTGDYSSHTQILSVTREVPDLPTEPGSVILDARTTNGNRHASMYFDGRYWRAMLYPDAAGYGSGQIKSFTLAKVVPS